MPHLVSSPAGEQHDATDSIYNGANDDAANNGRNTTGGLF
jgi:hypothetical protein